MFKTLIILNVFKTCFEHVENYCMKQLAVSLELPNVYCGLYRVVENPEFQNIFQALRGFNSTD